MFCYVKWNPYPQTIENPGTLSELPLVMESGNQCAMPWGNMKMARRKMKRAFWDPFFSLLVSVRCSRDWIFHQEYSTCGLLWLVLFAGNCLPLPRSAQSRKPWKCLCFERRDVLRELKRGIYWIPSWHTAVIVGVSTVDRYSFVCYPNMPHYVNVINVYIFFFKDRDSFSLGGSWTHYVANDGFELLTLLSPRSEC